MNESVAWVECDHPGCDSGLAIDARHTRNFEGRSWTCRDHETQEN